MITSENLRFREQWARDTWHRSFDKLLFITSAGSDGILFAHPIGSGDAVGPTVVAWVPIGDELTPVASSLDAFLEGWLTSAIEIR
jgi:hypothetical protein